VKLLDAFLGFFLQDRELVELDRIRRARLGACRLQAVLQAVVAEGALLGDQPFRVGAHMGLRTGDS
jgi:hypothetical protein